MTEKHFKAIAHFISKHTSVEVPNCIYAPDFIEELSNYFAALNPNFDRKQFENACDEDFQDFNAYVNKNWN